MVLREGRRARRDDDVQAHERVDAAVEREPRDGALLERAAPAARHHRTVVIYNTAHLRALGQHAVDAAQPLVQFISFGGASRRREQ